MTSEKQEQRWFSVAVTAAAEAEEALEFALNELDAEGTEADQLGRRPGEPVTVKGYFTQLPEKSEIEEAIANSLRIYQLPSSSVTSISTAEVEQTDWLAKWKQHWKPTVVGNFVIAPPWEDVDDMGRHVIKIEPNMAFGTGTHETTKLCLAALEQYFTPGDTLLDVGTGTGILAIAAAKLAGPSDKAFIDACDTDIDSVAIARENAMLNGVSDAIRFSEGSVNPDTPAADIVCANLTLDVILPLLDGLIARARKYLILSGILDKQEAEIVSALADRGHSDPHTTRDGEWIAVTLKMG